MASRIRYAQLIASSTTPKTMAMVTDNDLKELKDLLINGFARID